MKSQKGNEEKMIENWKKYDHCSKVAKNMSRLCYNFVEDRICEQ